jgi:hypothetical protein
LDVAGPAAEFKATALGTIVALLQDVARKPIELPPMLSGEIDRYQA